MTEIVNPLTDPPSVPVITDGQATFNTNASGWLDYWKNTIIVQMGTLVDKINIFISELNIAVLSIDTTKSDVEQLRDDTQVIKDDTQVIKDDTQVIKDDTNDIKNATVAYIDNTYGSSNLWNIVGMTTSTYTASTLDLIRVDPTTIGNNVIITLPTAPNNGDILEIRNVDLVRTNTLLIARGNALHLLNGELEDGEFNCNCSVKLVFDSFSNNWMKG